MAAQRKYEPFTVPAASASAPSRPRLADGGDLGGMNPSLAAQRSKLEAFVVDDEPAVTRYSGALRLAIILGGSAALWAAAAAGVWRLAAAL
jgi:hypothetical protein